MFTSNKVPSLLFSEEGCDNISDIPSSLRDHMEPVDLDFFDVEKNPSNRKEFEMRFSTTDNFRKIKKEDKVNSSLQFTSSNKKPVILRYEIKFKFFLKERGDKNYKANYNFS